MTFFIIESCVWSKCCRIGGTSPLPKRRSTPFLIQNKLGELALIFLVLQFESLKRDFVFDCSGLNIALSQPY